MALKLKLKPGEKFVVNGAVFENGDRPTAIIVKTFAHLMREKDIMQLEEANTPVKRAYYLCQLMLLDYAEAESYEAQFLAAMNDLLGAFINPDARNHLAMALESFGQKDYYKALATLKKLFAYEQLLLGHSDVVAAG